VLLAARPEVAAAGDPGAAIRRAMRKAEPAQPTAAHRTGSHALASGLHQPKRKQKIIGREDVDKSFRPGFPGFEVVRA